MSLRIKTFRPLPYLSMALVAGLLGSGAMAQPSSEGGFVVKCPHLPTGLTELPTCGGEQVTCVGTEGHDLIWGSEMRNVIYAGAGNDVIKGSEENDVICGGPGNDAIHGARGDDILYGDEGSDWLFGGPGADTLDGGPGDFDVLWGGPEFEQLDGGEGAFDYCLRMRDDGDANVETCEIIFPPIGFAHDEGEEIPAGLVSPTTSRSSGRRPSAKVRGQSTDPADEQEYTTLFVALTSPEANTQSLALTVAKHAHDAGKLVHLLLCGAPAELALRGSGEETRALSAEPRHLLQELVEKRISIDVCPAYLDRQGLKAAMLTEGVSVSDWPQTIQALMSPRAKFMSF